MERPRAEVTASATAAAAKDVPDGFWRRTLDVQAWTPHARWTTACAVVSADPAKPCGQASWLQRAGYARPRLHAPFHDSTTTPRTASLIRSNGELTYFASDTACDVDKRARGFYRLHSPAGRRPPRLRQLVCAVALPAPGATTRTVPSRCSSDSW